MPVTINLSAGATGSPTSAALVRTPAHGTVTGFPNTTVTYTPANGYIGDKPDFEFTFANASGTSNTATATVTVEPTLIPTKVKVVCLSIRGSSDDVAAAFEGASIALEGGGAKEVAKNVGTSVAITLFAAIVSGDDHVFGQTIELSAGVSEFLKKALKLFTKINPVSRVMEVLSLVFSGVSLASTWCFVDPPDSNYKVVALPSMLPIMPTGNATVDRVQADYLRYISLTAATVHAAERWQGAILAKAPTYETLQQQAFTKYSAKMITAKNVLKSDNLVLANALPSVNINSFPGGATAMAAAFNAQCGRPLPSDLNTALLSLNVSQGTSKNIRLRRDDRRLRSP